MRVYCTIFNAVYLVRGLALIRSLLQHSPGCRIHVFTMDEQSAAAVESMRFPGLSVHQPADFETPELLTVKPSRSIAEYFWTCTPSIVWHCLTRLNEPECTYVDADVWLLADPEQLFDEMRDASVLLTEHRYTPRHDQSALSGRFCVQFMRFVADERGLAVLRWWRDRCLEWCFARREGGKFGDQKYLDDWETRFECVHVLRHVGGGIAPWNVGRTEFRRSGGRLEVRDSASTEEADWRPLVFFHFHGLMSWSERSLCFAFGYRLPQPARRWIYAAYARELQSLYLGLRARLSGVAATGVAPGASYRARTFKGWARRIWGLPNTVRMPLSAEAQVRAGPIR